MPGIPFIDPRDGKKKLYFDLAAFEEIFTQGVRKLLEADFIPDALVGIPTGAWDTLKRLSFLFPDALVGQFDMKAYSHDTNTLDIQNSFCGDGISWRPSHNGKKRPPCDSDDSEMFESGKVLIVEDLCDSGWTLTQATPRIEAKCRKIFKSVGLDHFLVWFKQNSVILPRFYGMLILADPETGKTPWIVTPMDASCLRIADQLNLLHYPLPDCMQKL